jgi:regulator of protease activity HflC (stomatin/prohibitin superfamily)
MSEIVAPSKTFSRWAKVWFRQRRTALISFLLSTSILILLLWPYVAITIGSGEAGVFYSRLFGGTQMKKTYPEGLHFILPWDIMYIYDIRIHEETVDIQALSRGGLCVNMKISFLYYPIYDRIPELQQQIGQDYREKIIFPIMAASVRNTVGKYWPEDLYTSAPLKLQDEIMIQAVDQMGRKPLIIDNVVVRSISLPDTVNNAIDQKFAAEQDYMRYKYVLLKAGEEYKRRYIEAQGVRMFQETVNKEMTENFLRWSGIEATKELAASPNAKIVIVGGRDGLPLILNPDGASRSSPPAAQPTSLLPAHKPAEPASAQQHPLAIDLDTFKERYAQIENALKTIGQSISAGVSLGSPPDPSAKGAVQ